MTEKYPESNLVLNQGQDVIHKKRRADSKESFSIAPGEGKVPTSLMRDKTWDIDAFPHLHPDGRYGLSQGRKIKLSTLKYLICRLQSIDKRWAKNAAFLFAAVYCIEREQLERQINISYMRGKVVHGTMQNLEDVCHVFDNIFGQVGDQGGKIQFCRFYREK